MSEFEQYLSTKEDAGVTPHELRKMGATAAHAYIQEQKPLNDSILEMVKTSSLNLEQVRRIVEYANNDTFGHLFKAGHEKNITFPMADASIVMQKKGETMSKVASRKVLPRGHYIPGQEYVDLDEAFGAKDFEKAAEASGISDSERHRLGVKFLDLRVARENHASDVDILADTFAVKLSALKDLCKEAQAEGYSTSTIGAAIEDANPSEGLLDVIEIDFGDRLVEFGCKEKLAFQGMAVMPGNPITGLTQDLEGVSGKLVTAQQSMHRVQTSMTELLGILRGPDPGHTMASGLFNPGGMGSQPAPPPTGAAPAAPPSGGPPAGMPSSPPPEAAAAPAGGPPPSQGPVSGGAPGGKGLGALFGGKR